ncbi:MAG: aldo/keto reductase [Bacteriovoracaceae bacterium]|nr:aldo/keto reductase [Bacteriovoracaceae bacterium]
MTHLLSKWSNTPFAFGGAAVSGEGGGYGFGKVSDSQGLLERAHDLGITVFDTAPIYGFGKSEQVFSEFIKGKRDKVRVISKSGVYWQNSKRVDMTNDPAITLKMLEESLKRLKTDYIDLYMIHWPDPKVDIRYPLEVLAKAREEGKILEVGLCNTNIEDLLASEDVVPVKVIQSQHNIYEEPPKEVIDYMLEKEISFMGWGAFDKGILTGRVTKKREQAKNYDEEDCRKSAPWWVQKDVIAKCEKLSMYQAFAEESELELSELAMSYVLSPKWSHIALVGAKTISDLEKVLLGKRMVVTQEQREEIQKECRL